MFFAMYDATDFNIQCTGGTSCNIGAHRSTWVLKRVITASLFQYQQIFFLIFKE